MKKLLNLTVFLLILAGVLSACKKPDDTKIDYPINVPFEDYSLIGTECKWLYNLIDLDMLQQISGNEYSLYVDITMDLTTSPDVWFIPITVPKLSPKDIVTLNVNALHYIP